MNDDFLSEIVGISIAFMVYCLYLGLEHQRGEVQMSKASDWARVYNSRPRFDLRNSLLCYVDDSGRLAFQDERPGILSPKEALDLAD